MNTSRYRFSGAARKWRHAAAYSLVEVLVASGIMMIGVSAAAALSLAMVTQEEIGWRTSRGINMLENVSILYRLGLTSGESLALIPSDPDVTLSYVANSWSQDTAGTTQLEGVTFQAVIETADSGDVWSPGKWTAGGSAANPTRTVQTRVYRSEIDVVTGPSPGP